MISDDEKKKLNNPADRIRGVFADATENGGLGDVTARMIRLGLKPDASESGELGMVLSTTGSIAGNLLRHGGTRMSIQAAMTQDVLMTPSLLTMSIRMQHVIRAHHAVMAMPAHVGADA